MMPQRPALRYYGGKWQLARWIISHFPPHLLYVEPYGGAASVLLQKPRSYAEVYNDLDGEVVNLFRVLRDPGMARDLRRQVSLTPFSRREFEDAYGPTDDPVERARRTLVRSFMGYFPNAVSSQRSGFRARAHRMENGRTTTPAAREWAAYPDHIDALTARLRGVTIECRDALEVIRQQDTPHTLFYVDPPYIRANTRQGYRHEMTEADHRRLAEVLRGVQGMVVLSGYRCPLYDELYHDWQRVDRQAFAGSISAGQRPRVESLWLSPSALAARSAPRLLPGMEAA